MKTKSFLKLIKFSAWYDLIVTMPFAFPIVSSLYIGFFSSLHKSLGFIGEIPTFLPTHLLFVNLMGSIIIVWSILRICHTQPIFGLYDAHGRAFFSAWQIFYLVFYNASPVILLILIPEILFGVLQYWGYWFYKKQ